MPALAVHLLCLLTALCAAAEGWLGVYLDPEHDAPRVREFVPGSPAEAAGMKAGDVIVAIDAKPTPDIKALLDALRATKPGQTVAVVVSRELKELTLQVTLGDRPAGGGVPPEPSPDPTPQKGQPPSPADEAQRASLPILRDLAAAKAAADATGLSMLVVRGADDTKDAASQRDALAAALVQEALIGSVVVWVEAENGAGSLVVERLVAGVSLWRRTGPLSAPQLRAALEAPLEPDAAQRLLDEARRLAAEAAALRVEVERLREQVDALRRESRSPRSGK